MKKFLYIGLCLLVHASYAMQSPLANSLSIVDSPVTQRSGLLSVFSYEILDLSDVKDTRHKAMLLDAQQQLDNAKLTESEKTMCKYMILLHNANARERRDTQKTMLEKIQAHIDEKLDRDSFPEMRSFFAGIIIAAAYNYASNLIQRD